MSKLTEVLKLLCYDPETDGNLTFNVTEALTKNWEKIDQLVLLAVAAAAAYDPEGSYAVGDYCTHGGGLHKCNTEIPSGEAWNAAHWTATTVAAELAEVRTSLSNKVGNQALEIPNNDCNDIADFGLYRVQNDTANGYTSTVGDSVINAPWDMNAMFQLFLSASAGKMLWRTKVSALENPWSEWFPLATATPPQEGNIPVIDGMREVGQCMYFQQQDGTTFFFAVAGAGSDGAQISNDQSFAVTPIGARPKVQYYYPAVAVSGSDILKGYVVVNPDGTIEWVGNAVPYPGYIVSFGAFVAAKEN